jgi:BlaI family transcriptional regulator, penicillinase repressor
MIHLGIRNLPRRQRQLLDALYRCGPSTAEALRRDSNGGLSSSTIRTQLRNLETEGAIGHHDDGTRFVYWPVVDRDVAGQAALKYIVDTYYGGSIERVALALGSLHVLYETR